MAKASGDIYKRFSPCQDKIDDSSGNFFIVIKETEFLANMIANQFRANRSDHIIDVEDMAVCTRNNITREDKIDRVGAHDFKKCVGLNIMHEFIESVQDILPINGGHWSGE
mmetsp:Transcript_18200/g.30221  ORF Transcript_18200/g.30221 Transcript_18200/m.30221 type:complete len:111 (+) Transcript_18200:396-728(+)|eukprot:CAMPEP_0197731206 /NCGR_PEP_ID=MMETSP1434-20131217/36724_1 /TAXON_ID=265543 /ORGANISM="Minutocellus polymorphus, Strain CCMP3303" /LENGTH=110 /DNA_ID=CAMNT_0043318161 /DNA_START=389 /DNA_END=721 /DNA_ORIENTATION=+